MPKVRVRNFFVSFVSRTRRTGRFESRVRYADSAHTIPALRLPNYIQLCNDTAHSWYLQSTLTLILLLTVGGTPLEAMHR